MPVEYGIANIIIVALMELDLCDWLPTNILEKIAVVPPPEDGVGADFCYCLEDSNGNFSIANMYHNLCAFHEEDYEGIWQKIWKIKVPRGFISLLPLWGFH
ncbi:hypothetical protein TSUD_181240 [Trifolium subterraneum]|uniref:Uncharacterized protein n=1 Tax=Trifolium subterraneum TaxID=3900 RepID=A0A2Z6MKV0_TRISU|nr:hypothetical protein TSUD_181240 [Trifolium subterraneum]